MLPERLEFWLSPPDGGRASSPRAARSKPGQRNSMKEVFLLRGKANETRARKRRSVRDSTKKSILLLCAAFFCFALLKSPTLAKKDEQPQESSFPVSVRKHVSFEVPGENLKTSPETN